MENWQKAMRLEEFMRGYTPKGFREPIHRFASVPYILETDYINLEEAHKHGTLQDFLRTYKRQLFDIEIYPFNIPYLIDAIETYFGNKEI